MFATCAYFPFPSYVPFTIFFGLLFQLTHTHTKIMFSHNKVMSVISVGFSSRKFPSDTSGGWFTRLLIERGPMPRCATNTSHLLNRLKPINRVTTRLQIMTLSHLLFEIIFIKFNLCTLIN